MLLRLVVSLFIFTLPGLSDTLSGQDIAGLLPSPEDLPGWKIQQGPDVYVDEDLFDLIDGGADIYFEYGFKKAISIDYFDQHQNITQAEIYEMQDASAAYGIFSLTQQVSNWNSDYGQLAVTNSDYIAFWKGKYYVNISWVSRNDASSNPMEQLAEKISSAIADEGAYPDLILNFNALDPGKKTIFLNGNLGLSNFYYFDYKDIFQISDAIACTVDDHHRIVFRYTDDAEALKVFASVKQAMINNKRFSDVSMVYQGYTCKDNKGNVIMLRQSGRYIVVLVALEAGIPLTPIMEDVILKVESVM